VLVSWRVIAWFGSRRGTWGLGWIVPQALLQVHLGRHGHAGPESKPLVLAVKGLAGLTGWDDPLAPDRMLNFGMQTLPLL